MKTTMRTTLLAAALAAGALLSGCAGTPSESARIRNLDQRQVAGSVLIIHDNAGEARIELDADGTASATNIWGSRTLGSGTGTWMLSPGKDSVCFHGTTWWHSLPCWSFYGADWAHATDVVTTFNNGAHFTVRMEKTGAS